MRQSEESEDKSSPRVLMFVPQYPFPVVGGLERQSHELSKALRLHCGLDIRVLSGKVKPDHPEHEVVDGVPVTRFPWFANRLLRFVRLPFDVALHLWRLRHSFDILHLHQHSSVSLFAIVVAGVLGKETLTKLPNVGDYGIPGLKAKHFGELRLKILLRSRGLIAMTRQSVNELLIVDYPKPRILTVPNGISKLNSEQDARIGKIDRSSVSRVVFVGRLSAEKGLDNLLHAWVTVQRRLPGSAILEIWGDGPLRKQLEQYASDLQLERTVLFRGHMDEVRLRLREADIFVLPSAFEGNSNSVLEAMEAGLPVVATPVGGTAMQVGPKGSELLFPVGDVAQLARCLMTLIKDPDLRERYGKLMRDRIAEHFDILQIAEVYAAAYRQLTSGNPTDLSTCARLPEDD